ncbi:GNAT family N-acetyltransferase [Sutcliffiella rhizosphaerae]|uniref:GNAT family N-acetyltransferase n=1 Tax=Sutcliffiella rhizosphaerae TaxID=2880967 RepID=UPI001E310FEC|nr:GNAT family N-acetyltransferase [Sutcliffiella rhizosphaerae]
MVPSAQGKGYATEAVQKLVEWALSNKNVTKIVAECLNDNVPSMRVLEKLQMKRIGSQKSMLNWQLEK